MKYLLIAAAGLTLAACQSTTETTVIVPETCDAAPYQQWVGKRSASLADIPTPENMRIIKPDSAVTMDFDPSRLNVETNSRGTITAVRCG